MTNNATNRISAILDENTPTQSVKRVDNALSSSGATADYGPRPVREPIKDDLLARLIAPPSDARKKDPLFWQIRERLIEEFRPTTFSQTATIDALTDDYMQLTSLRSAKGPSRPIPMFAASTIAAVAEKRQQLDAVREKLQSICAALEFLGGKTRSCEPEHAERVVDLIIGWIKRLEMDVNQTQDSPAEEEMPPVQERHRELMAKVEEFEREELQGLQAEWASLQKSLKKLTNREYLYYFFTGLSPAGRRERDRLQGLLQRMKENQEMLEYFRRLGVHEIDEPEEQEQPTKESVLRQRQISDIEKSIERKLKNLRQT